MTQTSAANGGAFTLKWILLGRGAPPTCRCLLCLLTFRLLPCCLLPAAAAAAANCSRTPAAALAASG